MVSLEEVAIADERLRHFAAVGVVRPVPLVPFHPRAWEQTRRLPIAVSGGGYGRVRARVVGVLLHLKDRVVFLAEFGGERPQNGLCWAHDGFL